jgi:1-acyl-sn-glycerol-3-phosphate acyltransferase
MDDIPYGLAHEIPIQVPGLHHLLVPLGAVRASHENARRIFDCGKKALVYPGGDVDAMRAWSERKRILFDSRVGYIRLALRSGVSIVPLVSAGAHEVLVVFHHGRGLAARVPFLRRFRLKAWPISFTIPWGITMGPMPPFVPLPTRIFQELLPPIHFDRSGESAATDALCVRECDARVRAAMQDTLTRLYAERDGE